MIGLVSCCGPKLSRAARARELYTSTLFRMSLAYLLPRCSSVYVMSAKLGLVELDQVVEPYDVVLSSMPLDERRAWGERTFNRLADVEHSNSVTLLAGRAYAEPFERALRASKANSWRMRPVLQPLRGLQIGQRLQWLAGATRQDGAA